MPLSKSINENISKFKRLLRADESFDLIYRTIKIYDRTACMFYIDGFVKDDIMEKVMEFFYSVDSDEYLKDAHMFSKRWVPYLEVDLSGKDDKIITSVLSGMLALMVDGFEEAILIDVRTYPQRDTQEPEKDKVLRGSRDGFVETLVSNTALIRRRIRSPELTMKIFSVGNISKTDVVICYMDDKVDKNLLDKISNRLNQVNVDSLTMNQESLMEALYDRKWYNPFPKAKQSERPDTAASAVLEGNLVILVDTSPSVTIIPTSIFDLVEEADDYYFPPITGTYLRLSRYIVTLATVFLTPLWLLLIENPGFIPPWLNFIQPKEPINIPIFWQLVLLEFLIDGLRLAALNTPSSINTTLSIIGAIVLSDFAVSSGWFNSESMLYMAFVAISNYSQPSFELGYALKFMRTIILALTALFNLWGFIAGVLITIIMVVSNRTISGKSYIYPIVPFNGKELMRKLFRTRLGDKN